MRDTVLVSIDYNDKTNTGVLCVGRQFPNKSVDMVNAIGVPEAGRKGYTAWKTEKETVISPAAYGTYIL